MDIDVNIQDCVRSLPFWSKGYPKIPMPSWAVNDPLARLWKDFPTLLKAARVVWAHIVQANELLFQRGSQDCPGEVVYDPRGLKEAGDLAVVAEQLFSLKGTKPFDSELVAVADHLTSERSRVFGRPVPKKISEYPLRFSTIFFCRKHLPNRRLSLPCFPILVNEECLGSVMVLPSRWWPAELIDVWKEAS